MILAPRKRTCKGQPPNSSDSGLSLPRLTFGKYTGFRLDEVPEPYLFWLLETEQASPRLLRLIREFLEVDLPETDENPSPDLAAVILPGVVWRWQDTMRARFAGNAAALAVVDAGEQLLRHECTRFTGKPFPADGSAA